MPPTPTAGRASPTSSSSTARSAPAARRCSSATCIPRTRPRRSTTRATSAPAISARWVDDGYLVVTGRAKDIIIRNGENISPKEVEDILDRPSGDRRDRGRRRARRRAPANGRAPSSWPPVSAHPSLDDLRDFLIGEGLAKFKVPEQVVHLGRAAEERRGQGPEASDPSDADQEGGLTCRWRSSQARAAASGSAARRSSPSRAWRFSARAATQTGSPNWRRRSAIPSGSRRSPST